MATSSTLTRFSADFGVPFLLGQRCVIADPLGVDGFANIKHGLGIDAQLNDACEAQFVEAAHFCDVTPAPFDHDAATLLYAAHELFAATHPQSASFYARAHLFAQAATVEVDKLPRTLDPSRLVTRHLIARRMFRTTRTDVHVKWWTGSESFYGEEPPARLVAWPSLRRVEQQRLTQPMWRLALGTGSGDEVLRSARQALMTAVLDASPLTRLLCAGQPVTKQLGFSLVLPWKLDGRKVSPLDVLEDRRLARAVVDSMLADGLDVGGSAVALALLQGLREGTSPQILRRAAELCTHLAVVACHIEAEAPGAAESRPLVAFVDGDPAAINEATRVYWAAVAATIALGNAGIIPVPDVSAGAVGAVWQRLLRRLEHKRIAAVSAPLLRELQRRLPRPSAALSSSSSSAGDDGAAPATDSPDTAQLAAVGAEAAAEAAGDDRIDVDTGDPDGDGEGPIARRDAIDSAP